MTPVSAPTTTELVERAQKHDPAAWEELVARYSRLVWHVILGFDRLSPDRRNDVHQTTWLRLAENLDTLQNPEQVGSWLATVARNECLRLLERQRREVPSIDLQLGAIDEPLERHLLETERDVAVWEAFRALDEQCQQLLRLLLVDPPFSYDEISAILDMKRGSIGPVRRRCLDLLKKSPSIVSLGEPL